MIIHRHLAHVAACVIALCSTCSHVAIARPPCQASARAQVASTSVATVTAGVVAVPFAVPVAMPSYVHYSAYVAATMPEYQSHAPLAAAGTTCAIPMPAMAASLTSNVTAKAPASSLVATHCVQCHGPMQPKAGLDLSGALDDATRLKAITRILADDPQRRMPKGKELSAAELGRLIQELATISTTPASADAPPAPGNLND